MLLVGPAAWVVRGVWEAPISVGQQVVLEVVLMVVAVAKRAA